MVTVVSAGEVWIDKPLWRITWKCSLKEKMPKSVIYLNPKERAVESRKWDSSSKIPYVIGNSTVLVPRWHTYLPGDEKHPLVSAWSTTWLQRALDDASLSRAALRPWEQRCLEEAAVLTCVWRRGPKGRSASGAMIKRLPDPSDAAEASTRGLGSGTDQERMSDGCPMILLRPGRLEIIRRLSWGQNTSLWCWYDTFQGQDSCILGITNYHTIQKIKHSSVSWPPSLSLYFSA